MWIDFTETVFLKHCVNLCIILCAAFFQDMSDHGPLRLPVFIDFTVFYSLFSHTFTQAPYVGYSLFTSVPFQYFIIFLWALNSPNPLFSRISKISTFFFLIFFLLPSRNKLVNFNGSQNYQPNYSHEIEVTYAFIVHLFNNQADLLGFTFHLNTKIIIVAV